MYDEETKKLFERSLELQGRSVSAITRAKTASKKAEDVRKRSDALIAASKLARGDREFILKKCSCGREYHIHDWFQLQFAGYQESQLVAGEMRNCECESTMLFITRRSPQ